MRDCEVVHVEGKGRRSVVVAVREPTQGSAEELRAKERALSVADTPSRESVAGEVRLRATAPEQES